MLNRAYWPLRGRVRSIRLITELTSCFDALCSIVCLLSILRSSITQLSIKRFFGHEQPAFEPGLIVSLEQLLNSTFGYLIVSYGFTSYGLDSHLSKRSRSWIHDLADQIHAEQWELPVESRGQLRITHDQSTGSRSRWSTSFDHVTGLAGRGGGWINGSRRAPLAVFHAESSAVDSCDLKLTDSLWLNFFSGQEQRRRFPLCVADGGICWSCFSGRKQSVEATRANNGVDWRSVLLTEYSRSRAVPGQLTVEQLQRPIGRLLMDVFFTTESGAWKFCCINGGNVREVVAAGQEITAKSSARPCRKIRKFETDLGDLCELIT
ncbi:hypothetical protein SASPL_150212 [Salvia splendens]|uniref:Uncharacterized protein n=1 Tax=Salvia splendens TaxID=180675 RepID=A0A8X8W6D7_SALSN|nr:hypothetical protein SASPL_150212 [Salvia splendens]